LPRALFLRCFHLHSRHTPGGSPLCGFALHLLRHRSRTSAHFSAYALLVSCSPAAHYILSLTTRCHARALPLTHLSGCYHFVVKAAHLCRVPYVNISRTRGTTCYLLYRRLRVYCAISHFPPHPDASAGSTGFHVFRDPASSVCRCRYAFSCRALTTDHAPPATPTTTSAILRTPSLPYVAARAFLVA